VALSVGVTLLGGCVTLDGSNARTDAAAPAGPSAPQTTEAEASTAIQAALQTAMKDLDRLIAPDVHAFYQRRQFAPAWTDPNGLTPLGRQVREVIETAWMDGLTGIPPLPPTAPPRAPGHPSDATGPLDPAARARLDVALTAALTEYAQRAIASRPLGFPGGASAALVDITDDTPAAARPGRLFRLFSDTDRQARLRQAVLAYETIARAGGWPVPPASGPKLEPGAVHPDIAVIRQRLITSGDHTGGTPVDPYLYDAALARSVERFQDRHGLNRDATIGPQTREALATPIDQRLRQMILNLQRLRALPPAPAGRSIEVNIPAAHLEGRDNGVTTFQTDVIVGRSDRPTPELRSAIDTMVLNPSWTVPISIARKDILPKVRKDPEYLARSGFTVFSGWDRESEVLDPTTIDWTDDNVNIRGLRLRQAPGSGNALGRIKFLFPNDHDVYLHSTPSRGLFGRSQRTFSSGCVRVRDPMDLAAFVMNDSAITGESISERVRGGRTQTVHPVAAVPVSIVYLTAWVDEAGVVQFRRDVYGHDAQQMDRIAWRPTPSVTRTAMAPSPQAGTERDALSTGSQPAATTTTPLEWAASPKDPAAPTQAAIQRQTEPPPPSPTPLSTITAGALY